MPRREDNRAVINWQNWLNNNYGQGWMPISGFMAIIGTVPQVNNTANYNPNYGYPLKCFVNSQTGEVKCFDARKFYL
jgi:hypothetical protein